MYALVYLVAPSSLLEFRIDFNHWAALALFQFCLQVVSNKNRSSTYFSKVSVVTSLNLSFLCYRVVKYSLLVLSTNFFVDWFLHGWCTRRGEGQSRFHRSDGWAHWGTWATEHGVCPLSLPLALKYLSNRSLATVCRPTIFFKYNSCLYEYFLGGERLPVDSACSHSHRTTLIANDTKR